MPYLFGFSSYSKNNKMWTHFLVSRFDGHMRIVLKFVLFFSVTCILRHMKCDRSNRLKCPMCMEFIFTSDLKSVQFESQETSYHSNESAHNQDEKAKVGVKSVNKDRIDTEHKLEVNRHYSFRHLAIPKGSIRPQFPDLSDSELHFPGNNSNGGNSLGPHLYQTVVGKSNTTVNPSPSGVGSKISLKEHISLLHATLPDEMLPIAKYARIMYRNLLEMEQVYQQELQALKNYRAQCFNTELLALGEVDSEAVPYIDLAIELLQEKYQQYEVQLSNRFTHVEEVKERMKAIPESKELSEGGNTAVLETMTEDALRNYFYQAENGALIFLHPLSARILLDYYQSKLVRAEDLSQQLSTTEMVQELIQEIQTITIDDNEIFPDINNTVIPPPPPGLAIATTNAMPQPAPIASTGNCTSSTRTAAISKSSGLPLAVKGRVVDIEKMKLTKGTKQKFQFLRHLPQYSEITLVELDMKPLVSKEVYQKFAEEIQKRQQKRKEKQRMENLEKKLSEEKRFVDFKQCSIIFPSVYLLLDWLKKHKYSHGYNFIVNCDGKN
jgi:hypothetical protein